MSNNDFTANHFELEDKILKQIENNTNWTRVSNQKTGCKVDLVTQEGKSVQHITSQLMPKTGNAYLPTNKWNDSKGLNEIWSFGLPTDVDNIFPLLKLWVIETSELDKAIQSCDFTVKAAKNEPNKFGYIIPREWLEKHASKSIEMNTFI